MGTDTNIHSPELSDDDLEVQEIKRLGLYLAARRLPNDRSVAAIGNLLFTRAIYLGCDMSGWKRRYCYNDPELAMVEFRRLLSASAEPQGWIATRP